MANYFGYFWNCRNRYLHASNDPNVFFGALKPKWNKIEDAHGLWGKLPYGLLVSTLLIFGLWPSLLLNIIRPATAATLTDRFAVTDVLQSQHLGGEK